MLLLSGPSRSSSKACMLHTVAVPQLDGGGTDIMKQDRIQSKLHYPHANIYRAIPPSSTWTDC